MNTLIVTLLIAFAIILVSLSLLGIGRLLTGKAHFRLGMCGKVPTKKRSKAEGCGSDITCGLCGRSEQEDE